MQRAGCRFLAASSSLLVMLLVSGCTTLRPVAGASEELQRRILDGELLAAGDRVRLTTADGTVHDIRIESLALDAGTISGDGDTVAIKDLVALERRVRAPGKTWGLVLGGLAFTLLTVECEDDPSCDLGYGGNCC